MNVVVTGGSGRIGNRVVHELLAHGHTVRNVDRTPPANPDPDAPFTQADATDFAAVRKALEGAEAVVHLAAIVSPNLAPQDVVYRVNVLANFNVLQAAGELGIPKVCLASSVNAVGLSYSRAPVFDYFPLDERHATRAEETYSLSKWAGEQTADGFARRYEGMTIASLRFHAVCSQEHYAKWKAGEADPVKQAKHLWSYTDARAAARAARLAVEASFKGHQAFFVTAADSNVKIPSAELAKQHYPSVPLRSPMDGFASFFDCSKAQRMLGWTHPETWR